MEGAGGWEQTKENIQPLSSGRRMAHLAEALPTRTAMGLEDHLQYEKEHLAETERLIGIASKNEGPDPLQAWLDATHYMEQHFPNMSTAVKEKYSALCVEVMRCFARWDNGKYCEDERYVDAAINALKVSYSPERQICFFKKLMSHGVGKAMSKAYRYMAELYDSLGDTKNASDILRCGLANNAEPKQILQEMLTHIQDEWANKFAKQLQDNDGEPEAQGRQFASSVPVVGEKNEAVSIRQNLQPAAATGSVKPTSQGPKVKVYNKENTPSSSSGNGTGKQDLKHLKLDTEENKNADRENRLDACRWNARDTELDNPALPEPPAKMQLFVDEDAVAHCSSAASQGKGTGRALQERKEEISVPSPSEEEVIADILQPPAAASTTAPPPESAEQLEKESTEEAEETDEKPVKFKRYYDPHREAKEKFLRDPTKIKYKELPKGGHVNRLMLLMDKWNEKREKQMREAKADKSSQLRQDMKDLQSKYHAITKELTDLKPMVNRVKTLEQLVQEKETRISKLEAQNEDLMAQLTKMTTEKNVQDSKYQRLQFEKLQSEKELAELAQVLEKEREELEECRRKCQALEKENSELKRMKRPVQSEEEWSHLAKKPSFVDLDVYSRAAAEEVEVVERSSSPGSSNQGGSNSSPFQSGETTVEHQRSVAGSSFMPMLDKSSMMMMSMDASSRVPLAPSRRVLGLVERGGGLDSDMMNITPAAPPRDFEIPPPVLMGMGAFRDYRPKKFSLYESLNATQDRSANLPKVGPQTGLYNSALSKRQDVVRNLQCLPENQAPPTPGLPIVRPTVNMEEEPNPQEPLRNLRDEGDELFRRPPSPADEMPVPTLPKPRRSMILRRYPSDEESDEEDRIVCRQMQTGMDFNVSNLTVALMERPKPLINSTPERERTLRNLPRMPPTFQQAAEAQEESSVPTASSAPDGHGGAGVGRTSRFSMLHEPNEQNLSTIQETSREYRSRSTTGSSSGTGTTMSSTRLGGGNATNLTHLTGNLRSASIPRSASRGATSQNNNNNGYYSDSNQ